MNRIKPYIILYGILGFAIVAIAQTNTDKIPRMQRIQQSNQDSTTILNNHSQKVKLAPKKSISNQVPEAVQSEKAKEIAPVPNEVDVLNPAQKNITDIPTVDAPPQTTKPSDNVESPQAPKGANIENSPNDGLLNYKNDRTNSDQKVSLKQVSGKAKIIKK